MLEHFPKIKPFRIIVYHVTFCVAGLTRVFIDVTAFCSRILRETWYSYQNVPVEQTDLGTHLLPLKKIENLSSGRFL